MANVNLDQVGEALAANGTALGVITVASTVPYYPTQIGFISQTGGAASKRFRIVNIVSATTMRIQFLPDDMGYQSGWVPTFGYSDCSAYTTASGARIDMPPQTVPVFDANIKLSTANS